MESVQSTDNNIDIISMVKQLVEQHKQIKKRLDKIEKVLNIKNEHPVTQLPHFDTGDDLAEFACLGC